MCIVWNFAGIFEETELQLEALYFIVKEVEGGRLHFMHHRPALHARSYSYRRLFESYQVVLAQTFADLQRRRGHSG